MTTKLIILGEPGEPLNGKNAFIEVDGQRIIGEIKTSLYFRHNEVATAVVEIVLPAIEYRLK
jgi:hypothetical protein